MTRLIKNGRVIDPLHRIDAGLNVLIEDGKIRGLSGETPSADVTEDASGLVVCPGFIDLHAHEDTVVNGVRYADERKANLACLLRMGVTSCLTGNCGDNFCEPAEFLDLIDREGCFVNVAMLAGYTYYREKYSKADCHTPATAQEREKIVRALSAALNAGCAGVSFGLEYVPGMDGEELSAAAECCSAAEKMIAVHIRSCAEGALRAAAEVLELGKTARIPVELSHIGSMAAYGQMEQFLKLVDEYRASGVNAGCDCYPYDAFSTRIGSAPYDDLEAMHCGYGDIELCEGTHKGERCTKELFEAERNAHPDYLTIGHVMNEEEIVLAYRHPDVTVGSDCFLSDGKGHPRAAGAFPRFLSRYAPKSGLSLCEALSRITSIPARRLGLSGKGTLFPGADADLVIYDPEQLSDCATFSEPTRPPKGIREVIIAGETAVLDGKIVNGALGRAIRL